jgi:hypothetical protein
MAAFSFSCLQSFPNPKQQQHHLLAFALGGTTKTTDSPLSVVRVVADEVDHQHAAFSINLTHSVTETAPIRLKTKTESPNRFILSEPSS